MFLLFPEQMTGNIQHETAMPGKRSKHALALLPLLLFPDVPFRLFLFSGLAYDSGIFLPDFLIFAPLLLANRA